MIDSIYITITTMSLAGLATWWSISHIIRITRARGLYDQPDLGRKLHKIPIPVLGGIGIFLGYMIALVCIAEFTGYELHSYFILSLVILMFVGIADDLVPISARYKLIFQIFATCLVLYNNDAWIRDFNGVFNISIIPIYFAVPLSIFVIVLIINAYNMIDGVDGLAGSQGALASSLFGFYFLVNGNIELSFIAFALTGALIGFLYYNQPPARIFMGDTGSLVVGFILGYLTVEFVSQIASDATNDVNFYSPIIVVSVLIIPLYDILRVVIVRKLSGRLAFSPSRDHVHHTLIEYGFGAQAVSLYLLFVQLMVFITAITLATIGVNINIMLAVILAIAVLTLPLRPGYIVFLYLIGLETQQRATHTQAISNNISGDAQLSGDQI